MKNDRADSLNCTLGDTCLTESDELLDDAELEDGTLVPKPDDSLKVIEQKLAFVLLKLENCFRLISSALVPVSNNILADFFNNHDLQVDQVLIKELFI